MSVRITSGTSWPGKRPGVRHWFSVSYYLHLWELGVGGMVLACILTPLLLAAAGAWIGLESLVILASVVLVLLHLGMGLRLDWKRVYWQRLGFGLWSVLVPEKGER